MKKFVLWFAGSLVLLVVLFLAGEATWGEYRERAQAAAAVMRDAAAAAKPLV